MSDCHLSDFLVCCQLSVCTGYQEDIGRGGRADHQVASISYLALASAPGVATWLWPPSSNCWPWCPVTRLWLGSLTLHRLYWLMLMLFLLFRLLLLYVAPPMLLQLLPCQVVAKACKPLPVVVLGSLLGRTSHPPQRVGMVLMLVLGLIIFLHTEEGGSGEGGEGLGVGGLLLFASLLCDGLTAAVQVAFLPCMLLRSLLLPNPSTVPYHQDNFAFVILQNS